MAQPQPYDRQYSFKQYQSQHPSDPLPGDEVDAEFNAVKASLDETQANLALIQRDDGALANQSVGYDQLKSEVTVGIAPVVPWASNIEFLLNAMVFNGPVLYRCTTEHLSGSVFDASKFLQVADFSAISFSPGCIGTTQLADGAVTTAKIADGAVTLAKIGSLTANTLVGRAGSGGSAQTISLDTDFFAFSGTTLTWALGAAATDLGFLPLNPANNGSEFANKATTLATLGGAAVGRQIIAGTGLTGGGTLAADRTLTVAYGTGAGTAAQGNDSRITGAVQAANNGSDFASVSTTRSNLGLRTFSTASQTGAAIGAGQVWSESHGITTNPTVYTLSFHLTCLSAELGYSVGDVVALQSGSGGSQNEGAIGWVHPASSGAIGWAVGSNGIRIIQKDGTAATVITPAKWSLVMQMRYEA